MKQKCVVVFLKGGLGNQCFEYAAARALALRTDSRLRLNLDYFQEDFIYGRRYSLGAFNVAGEVSPRISPKAIRLCEDFRYKVVSRLLRKRKIGNFCCDFKPFDFVELPRTWSEEIILDGYWQSERYFYDVREQLLNDFTLKDPSWLKKDEVAALIRNEETVFIHLRSYKEVPGHRDGSMCVTQEFYRQALRRLVDEKGRSLCCVVFSDDMQWALHRLNPMANECGVKLVTSATAISNVDPVIRDFCLMQMCHNGVVANSSFSRFAGWLGEQRNLSENRKPIYVHNSKKRNGYCPDRWIRLEVE